LRYFPLREIGDRELGSFGDERSGCSMVETPKQFWTVRSREAMCREISHFGKSGIENSGVLVMRDRDVPWWKPRSSFGPSDLSEATCREISHFEKSGIANSGVLVMRDQDFPWWKPRDRSRTIRCKEATCREINRIEKSGIENLGVPWSRVWTLMMINLDEWTGSFQRIQGLG
jgi:hypothetical protein